MTELLEVPLVSVSKYQVVNAKLQDMYVAFTDFNTGLRSTPGWRRTNAAAGPCPARPRRALLASMYRFVVQRFLSMIATLVAVSIVIFLMVRLLPGNIIDIMFGGDATATPEAKAARSAAARPRRLVPVAVLALGQRRLPRRPGRLAAEPAARSRTLRRRRCRSRSSSIFLGLLIAVIDRHPARRHLGRAGATARATTSRASAA